MSYQRFDPDLYDEHFDDGRPLDNEIDDSPRMLFDQDFELPPAHELPISNEIVGDDEVMVGAEQEAIVRTLERARDNRRPCPPMKAVDPQAPLEPDLLGEAVAAAPGGPYPMAISLIEKHRAAGTPRIVRVDTEADYEAFRTLGSPERTALLQHLIQLEDKVAAHLADPSAHDRDAVVRDLGETAALSDAVEAAEADKKIPLRMPKHFDGLLEGWHQGGMAASTMILPRKDGSRCFVTASERVKKGELEAAKAAVEAGVPAAAIVGYLPAIGASLASADAMKALASGAEDLLRRPEAQGRASFLVRLDPQVSPAIFALAELCCLAQAGQAQAAGEWNQLAAAAPGPVRQAMAEILAALKPQATSLGGEVADFFQGLWAKIRHLFGGGPHKVPAPVLPPPAQKTLPVPAQKALPLRAMA